MRIKKIIAVLATAGAVMTAGAMNTATAWAATPSAHQATAASVAQPNGPGWHEHANYSTYDECYTEGITLLVNGAFGGPFIAFKCVGNQPVNPSYWTLWVETPF